MLRGELASTPYAFTRRALIDGVGTFQDTVFLDVPDSEKDIPPGPEAGAWTALGYYRWTALNLTSDK